MNPIIEINNLSYSYPEGTRALDGVSLTIMPGEKVALVGPNGAGKSTLLFHLNGILDGNGAVVIDGEKITRKTIKGIRAKVGLVFQNPDDQLFSTTVHEDVAFGPIHQGLDKEIVTQRVFWALQAVEMSDYADRNPYRLSNGEKKRVAIATVLSMKPSVLVFDEPTAGLEPRGRREFLQLLQNLSQTLVVATHDLDFVQLLTPRTVLLNRGKVAADGVSSEILSNEILLLKNGMR